MRCVLITLFAAAVAAGPIAKATVHPSIAACHAAENCEVYTARSGMDTIRFKAGMGPGSEDYLSRMALMKRDNTSQFHTNLTYGDQKLVYGCASPGTINPSDMLAHANDSCPTTGTCISNEPYTQQIEFLQPTNGLAQTRPLQANWELSMTGEYDSTMRDQFVQIIQTMAGQNVIRTTQQFYSPDRKRDHPDPNIATDQCELVQQSGFFGVVRYASGGSLAGYMNAAVSVQEGGSGLCDSLQPFLQSGSIVAAASDIPGVGEIFGLFSAACSVAPLASG